MKKRIPGHPNVLVLVANHMQKSLVAQSCLNVDQTARNLDITTAHHFLKCIYIYMSEVLKKDMQLSLQCSVTVGCVTERFIRPEKTLHENP